MGRASTARPSRSTMHAQVGHHQSTVYRPGCRIDRFQAWPTRSGSAGVHDTTPAARRVLAIDASPSLAHRQPVARKLLLLRRSMLSRLSRSVADGYRLQWRAGDYLERVKHSRPNGPAHSGLSIGVCNAASNFSSTRPKVFLSASSRGQAEFMHTVATIFAALAPASCSSKLTLEKIEFRVVANLKFNK